MDRRIKTIIIVILLQISTVGVASETNLKFEETIQLIKTFIGYSTANETEAFIIFFNDFLDNNNKYQDSHTRAKLFIQNHEYGPINKNEFLQTLNGIKFEIITDRNQITDIENTIEDIFVQCILYETHIKLNSNFQLNFN